ncbi:MAG: hypothetical protein AAB730_02235 [Patescibacteria group bacterium]
MIIPAIRILVAQSPFLGRERAAILDQFFGLTAAEEIAWLDFLNVNPIFFDELADEFRALKRAAQENDTAYLERKLKELKEAIRVAREAEEAVVVMSSRK